MKARYIFLLAILFCLITAGVSINKGVYGSTPSRQVLTAEQARQWAQAWVHRKQGMFVAWQGATVGEPVVYYDLDGRPAVYVFSVYNGSQDVGHVIISYEALENPVLVFGRGVAPHLRCPRCVDDASLAKQGLRLTAKSMIYLGPLDFFYEVTPIDPELRAEAAAAYKRLLIPMGMDRPIAVTHVPSPSQVIDTPVETTPNLTSVSVASSATAVKIPGVPDYNQFKGSDYGYDYDCASGCAPTSGANIIHFWDKAGYSGLAYTNWRDTVYYLRKYMKTECDEYGNGATWSSDISPGMVEYAQSRGYNFTSSQYCWPGTNWLGCIGDASWDIYTSQIDQSYPVLIGLTNDYYGGHGVTGVGYDNDGGQYWIVHDNWPVTPEDVYVLSTAVDNRFYHTFIPPARDSTPPTVGISAPRYHQAGTPLLVLWKGHDDFSGIARYEVQYKYGETANWTDWFTSTTATQGQLNVTQTGTYYFRARAYDQVGNVSEWSTAQSIVYKYSFTGQVIGNRGYWIPGSQVTASPSALNTALSGYNGAFSLYFTDTITVSVAVSDTRFSALPPAKDVAITGDRSGWLFVLPPADDMMTNGNFENGLQGWSTGGSPDLAVVTNVGHTGDYALCLKMGNPSAGHLSQAVVNPLTANEPTLSWMYVVSGTTSTEGGLKVSVQGASRSITTVVPLTVTEWTHYWLDLAPLAGESVTITFELQPTTPLGTGVLLDEVSLGQGNREPSTVFLPTVMRNW